MKHWLRWGVAGLSFLLGSWILYEQEQTPWIVQMNRMFQDGLVEVAQIPLRPRVSVSLVEMDEPEKWTALDYSLFLKSLPKENPPVVVLESLPAEGNTAFDRAFTDHAMKQPRLILPVKLSHQPTIPVSDLWWLHGWKIKTPSPSHTKFQSIEPGWPDILKGTVAIGSVNLPAQEMGEGRRVALYDLLNDIHVPSLVLNAALQAWKTPHGDVQIGHTLKISGRSIPTHNDGLMTVDESFLPGLPRISSSDLLLRLDEDAGYASSAEGSSSEFLHGVIVLGDVSQKARVYETLAGKKISRAEIIAVAIATLCNGPAFQLAGYKISMLILTLCALLPAMLPRINGWWVCGGFLILFSTCIFLVKEYALILPIVMPVAVLLFGFGLHYLNGELPTKPNGEPRINPTSE